MAKHLKKTDVEAIVRCIYELGSERLTWEAICDAVVSLIGKRPTRQSLCKHAEIMSAYKKRKAEDFSSVQEPKKPASLSIAAQRIRRLEMEILELRAVNRRLYEEQLKLQYNAYKKGLKEWEISAELPKIDRERTAGKLT